MVKDSVWTRLRVKNSRNTQSWGWSIFFCFTFRVLASSQWILKKNYVESQGGRKREESNRSEIKQAILFFLARTALWRGCLARAEPSGVFPEPNLTGEREKQLQSEIAILSHHKAKKHRQHSLPRGTGFPKTEIYLCDYRLLPLQHQITTTPLKVYVL